MVTFFPSSVFRYLTPLFLATALFLLLEIFLFWPFFFWPVLLLIVFVNLVSIWQLVPRGVSARQEIIEAGKVSRFLIFFRSLFKKDFINFLLPTLFLTIGALLFIIFLPTSLISQLVILITCLFCYLFVRIVFLYLYRPEEYQTQSLENIAAYVSVITCYYFASSLLGLGIFIDFPLWQSALFYLLIIFLLGYQFFLFHHFESKNIKIYLFILVLLSGQIFWAVNFLPLNFYINGLILTIFYYFFIIFSRRWLKGELSNRIIWHYLLIGFSALIIILLTAQWR